MPMAIIIDPALKNNAGHHLNAATGWVHACHSIGLTPRVLAHKECILDSVEFITIEKTFMGHFYHVAAADQAEALRGLRIMQRRFRDAIADRLMRVQSEDVVVLAHSTLVTLNGIAAWASGLPRTRLPRLIVWLMMSPEDEDFVVPFGSTNCMAGAIDRLRTIFGDRLTLAGFTDEVCRRWKELCRDEIDFLPFISLRPALPVRKGHVVASPPVIVFVGHLGARKGLAFIPGLIRELERRKVEVRWMIAGECFEANSTAFHEIESLAKSRDNVSLTVTPVSLDGYAQLLTSADIVLLPYDPDAYGERGSGIAEEAEWVGLPYVAPKVAFCARPVSAGAAVPFAEWNVDGIAAAITAAVNDLQHITRAAEKHSCDVRKQFVGARESFLLPLLRESMSNASVPTTPIDQLPGVDIIITLYNYRRFLNDCLESVLRQNYPNWRCIVVDDCSTDVSFEEMRAIVAGFGDRFAYERHSLAGGQLEAIATGLSLGSNPFVLFLDADDCLMEDAVDVHVSWHLNKRVPVALTSGLVQVVDELGRLLAGSMDNSIWTDCNCYSSPLVPDDAYCRSNADFDLPSAAFIKQNKSTIGKWFWSPTSGLMFRRSAAELVLPDNIKLGRLAGDTFFAHACHAIGGAILIDKPVALYRRHGRNSHSDMAVYGAGTMAARTNSSNWDEVKDVLINYLSNEYAAVSYHINSACIDQILALNEAASQQEVCNGISPKKWRRRRFAEFLLTLGRLTHSDWLTLHGEKIWRN
jgi:glycosyltransferase involved in cell wall biosynthesis